MPTQFDIPTVDEMERLVTHHEAGAVSIYLPTEPHGQNTDAERLDMSNLVSDAADQLRASDLDRSTATSIIESLEDLVDDAFFWTHQARTLAVFADASGLVSHRLPNQLPRLVKVSDRFHVKPLLRTFTFPQSAFILAISQNGARLIKASPDLPAERVDVPDMPTESAAEAGRPAVPDSGNRERLMPHGRGHRSREGTDEEQKFHMRQYARQVNQAISLILGGQDLPLVVAGTDPMVPIYRSVNSYPHVIDETIPGNPDSKPDADLVAAVRPILDRMYANEIAELTELFGTRRAQGRAVTDLADVARAATIGAVDTLFVDIERSMPGSIDDAGIVTPASGGDATTYGITDEITRRVFMARGRVLAVRADEVPGGGPVAALLRFGLA